MKIQTAFSCPKCPEGVVADLTQDQRDRNVVPKCQCGAWMERLDDNVW